MNVINHLVSLIFVTQEGPIYNCEFGKMVWILDKDEAKNEHGDI